MGWKHAVVNAALRICGGLDAEYLAQALGGALSKRLGAERPEAALRVLFGLGNRLYTLETAQALRLGNGLHPKHRLTRYHDFFVGRLRAGERVLDVGCGTGALAADMAERAGVTVVGIELDRERLETARRTNAHPRVEYRAGDATRDLPEGRFDVVVLSNVLEHVADRSGLLKALLTRAAPGRFLIRVPLFERDWRVPLMQELGVEWRLDREHTTEYTAESFAAELSEAGLVIRHAETRWGEIWAEAVPG